MSKHYDVYIVGLGGQGILTIGDLLAQAAAAKGLKVNFYPTKGMSMRGGMVQGQLRIGRDVVGPALPQKGADLVVAMERSEGYKGIKYVHEGTDFLLYDDAWYTNAVIMGKDKYPELEDVSAAIKASGAKLVVLTKESLPVVNGTPVRANMFIMGSLLANTGLKEFFTYDDVVKAVNELFPKGAEANLIALKAGYEAEAKVL